MSPVLTTAQEQIFPNKRVNYSAGQLLGVAEFTDEQNYFLGKHGLHNLLLHGYGTVSGLEVKVDSSQPDDLEIEVEVGVGVDRAGKVFIVDRSYCASLKQWLDANPSFQGKSVYVVASYTEIETDRVVLAGQPCSNESEGSANSRIADSVRLRLCQSAPEMPGWSAIRDFQTLMLQVEIVGEAEEDDSEALVSAVRELAQRVHNYPANDPPIQQAVYRIPPNALRTVYGIWVQDVMPEVREREKGADPDILLAQINFEREPGDSGIKPVLPHDANVLPVDQSNRPYLLQTQVIQELYLKQRTEQAADINEEILLGVLNRVHIVPLVTITLMDRLDDGNLVFELWFHLDRGLLQPYQYIAGIPQLLLFGERASGTFTEIDKDIQPLQTRRNAFICTTRHDQKDDLAYLRFAFLLGAEIVKSARNQQDPVSLAEFMQTNKLIFEGHTEVPYQRRSLDAVVVYVRTPMIPAREITRDEGDI